jgi:hypothetical protein
MARSAAFVLSVLATTVVPSLAVASADDIATVASRGQSIRVLVAKPTSPPIGSVVLLAGGHGRLDIGADGKLGWGAGNQLVRTRADYARAGFFAVVPDIANDMKSAGAANSGVKNGYRWSHEQAADVGAVIGYARGLAEPVHLVATSRAALTAAKVGTSVTSGPGRPDSVVITAGMTMAVDPGQPSVEKNVASLGRIRQPVLLLHHAKDACAYTPASMPARFKSLLTGAARVDIRILDGGMSGTGDPCQAQSHHGFLGQDAEVVRIVTDWAKAVGTALDTPQTRGVPR